MRGLLPLCIALSAALVGGALAQETPATLDEARAEEQAAAAEAETEELIAALGVAPDAEPFIRMMLSDDMDPMMMFLVLALADGGGRGEIDDALGMMLLTKALGSEAKQPTTVVDGDRVLIVEDGVLYKISLADMAVEGQVAYKKKGGQGNKEMLKLLLGQMAQAGERAKQATLQAHLRTLQAAVELFRNDTGELPGMVDELTFPEGPAGYVGPYLREVPIHPFGGVYFLDPDTGKVFEER